MKLPKLSHSLEQPFLFHFNYQIIILNTDVSAAKLGTLLDRQSSSCQKGCNAWWPLSVLGITPLSCCISELSEHARIPQKYLNQLKWNVLITARMILNWWSNYLRLPVHCEFTAYSLYPSIYIRVLFLINSRMSIHLPMRCKSFKQKVWLTHSNQMYILN